MTQATFLGTLGVALLLMAFGFNLTGRLHPHSRVYLALNLGGALLACISSYLIEFWPFVLLEAVWMGASTLQLIKTLKHA